MSDLTDKQQRFKQLAALRLLAMHVGLIAPVSALVPSDEELGRRTVVYGAHIPIMCLLVIADFSASDYQRAACGVLLECFLPNWQDVLGESMAGMVVKRDSPAVRKWRMAVLERDGYQCSRCEAIQGLEAHHIVRWANAPHLRLVVDNGETLCKPCHKFEHAKAA